MAPVTVSHEDESKQGKTIEAALLKFFERPGTSSAQLSEVVILDWHLLTHLTFVRLQVDMVDKMTQLGLINSFPECCWPPDNCLG